MSWVSMYDGLKVIIAKDRSQMGELAASEAIRILEGLLLEQESARVVFASAPSQNEVLQNLKRDRSIDWSRIEALHMDEYVGLASDHSQSFSYFLKRALWDEVPIARTEIINGLANPDDEALRYERILCQSAVDLILLGIGENGHLAFNDPPDARFDDPMWVREVRLHETSRIQQVNDGCFETLDEVPRHALTLTIPCLMSAKHLIGTVPGIRKASAVRQTLKGPINATCPASILRTHASAQLFLDLDAASQLNAGTYSGKPKG